MRSVTGPIPSTNPYYSPQFSLGNAAWQGVAFLATAGNFSLAHPSTMGARGVSSLFAGANSGLEAVLCVGFWTLVAVSVWQARGEWRKLILPAAWIVVYIGPILLIRNHQVYYYQESLAGFVLGVGICLSKTSRAVNGTWLAVIALICINGYMATRTSMLDWQAAATQAEQVRPIIEMYRHNPPKAMVFLAPPNLVEHWRFVIGGPMIPHIIGKADMRVLITSEAEYRSNIDGPVFRIGDDFKVIPYYSAPAPISRSAE